MGEGADEYSDRVRSVTAASPADREVEAQVTAGLRAHLDPQWGDSGRRPITFAARDDAGRLLGGIVASIAWGWLYVDRLWVDDAHRRRGHGRRLLVAAEAYAREHGCAGVHLDTFGDDALPFYLQLGYEVWGTLDGLPPGGCKHALKKRL